MAHITWKDMAENLIQTDWGSQGESVKSQIIKGSDSRLQLCLLVDIAKSLRALRCSSFLGVPRSLDRMRVRLDAIERQIVKNRRHHKRRI